MSEQVDASGLLQGGLSGANSINNATNVMVQNNPAMKQVEGRLARANLDRQNAELDLQKQTLNFNMTATQMSHQLEIEKMKQAQAQFSQDYILKKQQIAQGQESIDNNLKIAISGQAIQEQGVQLQAAQLEQGGQQFQQTFGLEQQKIQMPQSEIGKFIHDVGQQSPGNQAVMENLFNKGQIKLPPGYQWGDNGRVTQIPGYTPQVNQEPANAAKIGGLKQAAIDWGNASNQIINSKDNSINRMVLNQAAVSLPGSAGLQVKNDMFRAAMQYAVATTPRGASTEAIKAKAEFIMPNWKGSDEEIRGQIKAFNNILGSTLNMLNGATPSDELNSSPGGLSEADRASLKNMGYSDEQINNAAGG